MPVFSIERAIATASHVVLLRMTGFTAWALARVLRACPAAREALCAAGINAVVFGVPQLVPVFLRPAGAAARAALAALQVRLAGGSDEAGRAKPQVPCCARSSAVHVPLALSFLSPSFSRLFSISLSFSLSHLLSLSIPSFLCLLLSLPPPICFSVPLSCPLSLVHPLARPRLLASSSPSSLCFLLSLALAPSLPLTHSERRERGPPLPASRAHVSRPALTPPLSLVALTLHCPLCSPVKRTERTSRRRGAGG